MAKEIRSLLQRLPDQLVVILLRLLWLDILGDLWKAGKKLLQGPAYEGMYEVLEYESSLELRDKHGKYALFQKREKVRYLQDNIIAYQDQAWGDGEILLNYRCTPGKQVDRYRPGRKTYILISLRSVKNKRDVDEFNIRWGMRNGFLRATELWETEINHSTKRLKVEVIFPNARPPQRTWLIEATRRRSHILSQDALVQLPNGRWLVSWETNNPRLHERYLLKWKW